MASSATSFEHLPADVTLQILYQLPVKSLIRFSSTSKQWRSVISDPQFAKKHFKLASARNTLGQRLLLSTASQLQSSYVQTPSFLDVSSVSKLTCPFWQPGSNIKGLGSCNGMVCVAQHGLYIWNPSTGFFLRLPEPGSVLDAPTYLWVFPLEPSGFGYVSATNEYKVVASAITFDGSTPMGIFSSRTNSWRMTEPVVRDSSILRRCTLFKEALHRVRKVDDELYEIIAFDLGEEEFRTIGEIPLPLLDEDVYRERYGVEAVFVFDGCLCVPVFERWNPREVQLWVMMEYGDCKSWTKLFQFVMGCDRYPFDGAVFDTEKGSIVVWRNKLWRGVEEDELIGMNLLRKDVVECSDPDTLEKGGYKL